LQEGFVRILFHQKYGLFGRGASKKSSTISTHSISHLFIVRQQACIQIAAAIYTQAHLRTSLFCFLLYQLSLWVG